MIFGVHRQMNEQLSILQWMTFEQPLIQGGGKSDHNEEYKIMHFVNS